MAITEAPFEKEKELHEWAASNIGDFLPGAICIPGFTISTMAGKHGCPDAFAFNLRDREWFVIESELLVHRVWPHIAEQVTRYVVAVQNPLTLRKIRDRLFEHLLEQGSAEEAAKELGTTPERLLQQIEIFIEGTPPEIVVFIDDTNKDLEDMVHALKAGTRVFRIQKFIVNGHPEYHSSDRNAPVIETEGGDEGKASATANEALEALGGAELVASVRGFKCYRLSGDGSIVTVRRSKFYESSNDYWYAISERALDYFEEYGVTHVVFVMAREGLVTVPLSVLEEYFNAAAGTSKNPDGSIRQYHILISPGPESELLTKADAAGISVADSYLAFE